MTETTLQIRVPTPLLRLGFDQNDIQRRIVDAVMQQAHER